MTGRNFKAWRETNGYSKYEIAQELKMSVAIIDRWEKGQESIPTFLQCRLRPLERGAGDNMSIQDNTFTGGQ